ncbi:MAG: hypothetical protein ISR48_01315 [Alphaproteobacteria bacterium]|nr:hypothetical protein [Alphaproteobacteria bacterium]
MLQVETPTHEETGWSWFDLAQTLAEGSGPDGEELRAVAKAFARCFRGAAGKTVLSHLRGITIERRLGPDASEASLRHLEGQRALVATILILVEQGKAGG